MFSPTELLASPTWPYRDLQSEDAEGAIRELHMSLKGNHAISSQELFLKDLIARHFLAPAALNADIALPHARTTAVNDIVLAIGRSRGGVKFDPEHGAVRLIVLIGTPKERAFDYLRLLATLTRVLHSPRTREDLISAADEAAFRMEFTSAVKSVAV